MERRLDAALSRWVVQSLARGALTVGLALGLFIIIGGRARWSSPSYEAALTYPYAPASWGFAIGAVALLGLLASLAGRYRGVAAALFLSAVWALFFCWSFLTTAVHNPAAATTAIPMYLGYACAAAVLAVAHWRSSLNALHR